jgi:hemoglobin
MTFNTLELKITQFDLKERAKITHKPDKIFLDALGEDGIRNMISDFYDLLIKSEISNMFPQEEKTFQIAKKHSADFFIQLCGGPDYFNQSRGTPQLSARHMPFKITPKGRIVWLECFREVILKLDISDDLKINFWKYLDVFSNWMTNTAEDE